jgi:hypothetical protein
LLWFDEDSYHHHPDAKEMGGSPELDYAHELVADVEELLLAAYRNAQQDRFTPASEDDYKGLFRRGTRTLLIVTAQPGQ